MGVLRRTPRARSRPIVRSIEAYVRDELGAPERFTPVLEPETITRRPPNHVDGEVHPAFAALVTLEQRAAFRARLPGARVAGAETIVLAPDHRAFLETAFDEYQLVRNRAYTHRLPAPVELAGERILLSNQWARAHFHWMLDTLPRLSLIPYHQTDAPILVAPDISATARETLRMVGIPDARIQPLPSEHVVAEELLLPSLVDRTGNPRRRTLDWLRDRLLPGAGPARRRIYVSREDAASRRLLNEDAVLAALAPHGFEKVVVSTLPLAEQLRTFAESEAIVAPHGGGLTSLLAARNATVVELFGHDYVNGCYYAMADQLRLPYWYLVGRSGRSADFTADVDRLIATLRAAGVTG
jgi:capsular polysaccharide biosynthesis protein